MNVFLMHILKAFLRGGNYKNMHTKARCRRENFALLERISKGETNVIQNMHTKARRRRENFALLNNFLERSHLEIDFLRLKKL